VIDQAEICIQSCSRSKITAHHRVTRCPDSIVKSRKNLILSCTTSWRFDSSCFFLCFWIILILLNSRFFVDLLSLFSFIIGLFDFIITFSVIGNIDFRFIFCDPQLFLLIRWRSSSSTICRSWWIRWSS